MRERLWLGHRLIVGGTNSGKTNFTLCELFDIIREYRHWVTFVAPHPQAALDLVAELYAIFGDAILNRLVVEQLGDTDRVIMRNFIQKSQNPDPWQRRMENDAFASNILSLLAARRKMEDFYEKPSLEEISLLTIKLYQNLDVWIPEYLIPKLLDPKHPLSKYAIQHCADEEVKEEFEKKINVAPSVAETSTKPVARMFSQLLANTAMRARTCKPARWDKKFFHNANGIFIIVANGCSPDAIRTYTFAEFQQVSAWARNGEIGPGLFVADEALNYGLITEYESRALATLRGFGVAIWYLTQSLNFPTDGIRENVLSNTTQFWFRQGNGDLAKIAANNLLPLLDEYQIHHYTRKQLHGGFSLLKRKGLSVTKSEKGKSISESASEQLVPQYMDYDEAAYRALNDQLLLLAARVEQLGQGEYFYSSQISGVGRRQAPLFRNSFISPERQRDEYQQCLQKIKATAIFEEPTLTRFQPPGESPRPTRMRKGETKS